MYAFKALAAGVEKRILSSKVSAEGSSLTSHRKRFASLVAAMGLVGIPSWDSADAVTLSFSLADAVGDNIAVSGDLTGLSFVFDNATGDYTIELTADAANPFTGQFRINVNLFNPDTGAITVDPAFFSDTLNDYDLSTPTTSIVLTGTSANLTSWSAGDRVAANHLPFGNPTGPPFITSFATAIVDLPFNFGGGVACISAEQDCLGPLDSSNFTTIVPEPGTLLPLGASALALAFAAKRRGTEGSFSSRAKGASIRFRPGTKPRGGCRGR